MFLVANIINLTACLIVGWISDRFPIFKIIIFCNFGILIFGAMMIYAIHQG